MPVPDGNLAIWGNKEHMASQIAGLTSSVRYNLEILILSEIFGCSCYSVCKFIDKKNKLYMQYIHTYRVSKRYYHANHTIAQHI